MSLRDDIDEARRTHDMQSILGTTKKKMVCPLPMHTHSSRPTPSFSIFWRDGHQFFKCHGNCNLTGDVIDLVGYLNISGYDQKNGKMVRKAMSFLDQKFEMSIPIPVKEVTLAGSEWFDYLPISETAIKFAHKRGLNDDTIQKFNLGYWKGFLSIPCFEDKRLNGVKMRRIRKGEPRFFSIEGSRQGLFNFDKVAYSMDVTFIVKGEIPCMLMDQIGFQACAPTGGEGGWEERWRGALALSSNIVIGDNDGPGRELGEKRALITGAKLVYPPSQYQDLDKWILGDPEGSVETITKWRDDARKEKDV